MSWFNFFQSKKISLDKNGAGKVLGDLESAVMEVMWEEHPVAIRSVRDKLADRGRDLSFNAIMTIMNRLCDKGILSKQKQDRIYHYSPTCTKEEFSSSLVASGLSSLFGDSSLMTQVNFADISKDMDPAVLKKLKEFVNQTS
jgi:predicted transcriptional regulator